MEAPGNGLLAPIEKGLLEVGGGGGVGFEGGGALRVYVK